MQYRTLLREPLFECKCVSCGAIRWRFAFGGDCSTCGEAMFPRKDTVHEYGDYSIRFDPKPIPSRTHDWEWSHKGFDGAPDSGDQRCGFAESVAEAVRQIDQTEHGG